MSQAHTNHLPAVINLDGIEVIEREGRMYMTCEQIGSMLGYATPRESILKIYQRNILELQEHTTEVKLTSVDAKLRDVRVFSEEGWYIISFLSDTDRAKDFRGRVAGLLRKIRAQALGQARLEGQSEGFVSGRLAGARLGLTVTDAERERLTKLMRYAGMNLNQTEMTKLLECSKATVQTLLKKAIGLGLVDAAAMAAAGKRRHAGESLGGRTAPLGREEKAQIVALSAQGLPRKEIAARVGVSLNSVKRVLASAKREAATLRQGV